MLYLLAYLFLINALGFLFMLADKAKARKGAWRIPERRLFAIALLGGSLGCVLGMRLLRHKTQHLKFSLGLPLLLTAHILLLVWLLPLLQ